MKIYLLDTNIWSDLYGEWKYALDKMDFLKKGNHKLAMSSITLGEFAYGFSLDSAKKEEFGKMLNGIKFEIYQDFNRHVVEIYGELRALLTRTYIYTKKKKKPIWLEELQDPTTSYTLGIQENDLWIVSQAISYGFTLVTADKKMKRIFDIIPQKYMGNTDEGFCFDICEKY